MWVSFRRAVYFDLSYAYVDEDTEIPKGAYVTLKAELKKNLTAGKYEENLTFTTKEGASCQVTLKVILGASSEKEYDLTVDHPEICFTEDDFYDPDPCGKICFCEKFRQKGNQDQRGCFRPEAFYS